MGEHKRRTRPELDAAAEMLTKVAADEGKVMALGWLAMVKQVIHPDAPASQLKEMRMAFYMGADFLFQSIMTFLEPGAEPTEKDLERFGRIYEELAQFRKEATSHHPAPERQQ